MEFNANYLNNLARIRTPVLAGGFSVIKNHQVYHDYCELRNSAKDLLTNPEDKESRKKLSRLVQKLNVKVH